eukprot:Pgem_evm1s20236
MIASSCQVSTVKHSLQTFMQVCSGGLQPSLFRTLRYSLSMQVCSAGLQPS